MNQPAQIGKYEIHGELGTGGMGLVLKGWDPVIARGVAIKSIDKTAHDDDTLAAVMGRFRQEAQAVGRLVHPGIVQIYDYLEDAQGAYIIMELVQGKTLARHLADGEHYAPQQIGQFIAELLDAIGYAHQQGVVHRDIKPSNILVNQDGHIKINDFGIAHVESSTLTQVGDLLGTPHYMSPEQFMGSDIDGQTDLFAIGVIAYELLTGKRPFSGSMAHIMQQVMNVDPPPPSTLNPQLSAHLDAVLYRALAKHKTQRYPNAHAFSAAFLAALPGDTPLATPDGLKLANLAQHLHAASATTPLSAASTGEASVFKLDTRVKQARLLIVDDDERILNALKSLFRQRYHVFVTTDGNKALAFLRKYQMHVIISDQRMPIMPGVELLRQAREIAPLSVRILLTGYSDLESIVGCINDGEVYRFINKPWDDHALQTLVAEAATIALELAGTQSAPPELPLHMSAGVLVIAPDPDLFRATRELVGSRTHVFHALDSETALQLLLQHEIAVVLADVAADTAPLVSLLKLLKQEHPQILALVVTQASDSESVIELINQAQVFRILSKPLQVSALKQQLETALQRYLSYQKIPRLTQLTGVEKHPPESAVTTRILSALHALRGRWFGAK